ncbi:MAG: tetratricopeptide repeat protein [Gemmatimonadota bacterium]|nr:tetratricopeptide repeat protein [Gemmatimonadota bacterium]
MELQPLLSRVLTLGDEGDWASAQELLVENLEEFDDEPAVHCWLGVAERELGLEGIAYERFRRALALDPEDPYVLATVGNGIAAFDDPDAEQALRVAAITAPEVALTRLLYGAYLTREGLFDEALAELSAASALDEEDPQVRYELGVLYAFQDRFDEAADALADAVRLDPDDGWTRAVFGLVLIEADRVDEGAGELEEAARLDAEDVEAQLAAALAAAATEREDAAYEMLERARMRAAEGDVPIVTAVEDRLAAGTDSARSLLLEDVTPSFLRARLSQRP